MSGIDTSRQRDLTHRVLGAAIIMLCLIIPRVSYAQVEEDTVLLDDVETNIQFTTDAKTARLVEKKVRQPILSEVSVGADLAGIVLATATSYGQYEASLRLGIRQRYYPILEAGIGVCDRHDDVTQLRYKTRSPYFRFGLDYNFVRRPETGNRIYGGLRIGYSPFSFDLQGPDITDPVWGDKVQYHFENVKSYSIWGEAVLGFDTCLYKFVRLGWSVRYRARLADKKQSLGTPWYIPGFGAAADHFSGTMNISFAI